MEIIQVSIMLFLIMDPFGNMPIFLSTLEQLPENRRRIVLVRELFLALIVIVFFIFFGRYALSFLGLRQESVSIAGGIILFLIALKMVFPSSDRYVEKELESEPLLVPLAIPQVAGPSLLAALILFASADPDKIMDLLLAALLAWGATFVILLSSPLIIKILTKRGIIAVERLMGMLLIALSVQLFLDGVSKYMN